MEDTMVLIQKMKRLQNQLQQLHVIKRQSQLSSNITRQKSIQQNKGTQQNKNLPQQKYIQNKQQSKIIVPIGIQAKNQKVNDLLTQLHSKPYKRNPSIKQRSQISTQKSKIKDLKQILLNNESKKKVRLNLTKLKQLNNQVDSNIFNLTIAQIMTQQHQKYNMVQQIKQLKDKLQLLEQNKTNKSIKSKRISEFQATIQENGLSTQRNGLSTQRNVRRINHISILTNDISKDTNQCVSTSDHQQMGKFYRTSAFTYQKNTNQQFNFGSQLQATSIQLKKNTNPLAWNPDMTLKIAQRRPETSERINRSGRFYSTLNIQKACVNSSRIEQPNKRPIFKSLRKKVHSNINATSIQMFKRKQTAHENENIQVKKQQLKFKKQQFKFKKQQFNSDKQQQKNNEQYNTGKNQQIRNFKQSKSSCKYLEISCKQLGNSCQKLVKDKIKQMKAQNYPPSDLIQNFRQYIKQKIVNINLPTQPNPFQTQQDLQNIGLKLFSLFDIDVGQEQRTNKQSRYKVTKYKNCVIFQLNIQLNIVWYFHDFFYYGAWHLNLIGQGTKQGFGIQITEHQIYQGYFTLNKRHGYGILIENSSTQHGFGVITNDPSTQQNIQQVDLAQTIYEGYWKNGQKHGVGYQIQDEVQYLGDFVQDQQTGTCKIRMKNTYYEGQVKESMKQGKGYQILKNGDQYCGQYKSNRFNGFGQYKWKNHAYYYGQFIQGVRALQGTWLSNINSSSFDFYKGMYSQNKKNGKGIYRWANGNLYQGYFKDDLRHDQGLMKYPNGKAAKFIWKQGDKALKIYSQQEEAYRLKRDKENSNISMSDQNQSQVENTNLKMYTTTISLLNELKQLKLPFFNKFNTII